MERGNILHSVQQHTLGFTIKKTNKQTKKRQKQKNTNMMFDRNVVTTSCHASMYTKHLINIYGLFRNIRQCRRLGRSPWVIGLIKEQQSNMKEEETYFCSTKQVNAQNKDCLLFPTTIHKVHTSEWLLHNRRKRIVSANGFQSCSFT